MRATVKNIPIEDYLIFVVKKQLCTGISLLVFILYWNIPTGIYFVLEYSLLVLI
jgi:hypothetical protein